MATPAKPEETMKILEQLGRPYDLSNGHGTISINLDGETYEVTTLRKDIETDGRHAKVEYVTDFEEDAARRDFTMNAMSMIVPTGEVFDYFGGQDDINSRIVRFVGNPDERIKEDYLRILRYFRFAARYRWFLEPKAMFAIERLRNGLNQISAERIWMEMKQIVTTEFADDYVQFMRQLGVWDVVINR
jgi:tRNA nucleotidyltransferase/poly(A) polymerase